MTFRIIDCVQNEPEWFVARCGIATASEFHTLLASGVGGGPSKTRAAYVKKVAGEIITGIPAEDFGGNKFTDRGHRMEADARQDYAFVNAVEIQQVGFIRNDDLRVGYSPDGLIGENGAVEFKSKAPHLLIDWYKAGKVPPEHLAQCQGGLWVSEREWIDIVGYYTGMPLFKKRIHRDEIYIAELAREVAKFNREVDELVAWIRAYGKTVTA